MYPLIVLAFYYFVTVNTRGWNSWRHSARKPSYMDKYTYHHYHPTMIYSVKGIIIASISTQGTEEQGLLNLPILGRCFSWEEKLVWSV